HVTSAGLDVAVTVVAMLDEDAPGLAGDLRALGTEPVLDLLVVTHELLELHAACGLVDLSHRPPPGGSPAWPRPDAGADRATSAARAESGRRGGPVAQRRPTRSRPSERSTRRQRPAGRPLCQRGSR